VGEALALPAAMATIVLLFPEGRARTRALSVWAAVASCGLVLGFVLSGIITEYLGWRWIFLIAVPFVLFVLIASVALLPRDRSQERAPLDILGSILLTSAPLLFAFGVVEAGDSNGDVRSEEHTSELQSRFDLVCRLMLEKKKKQSKIKSSVTNIE